MRVLFLLGIVTLYTANFKATVGFNQDEFIIGEGLDSFAEKFFKNVAEGTTGNLICSPIGASMILSMSAFGARGNTEKQLRTALALPKDDSVSKRGLQTIIDSFKQFTEVDLRLANKIFVAEGFAMKPNFKYVTETYFRSSAQSLNFGGNVAAAKIINKWVATETNNRIKDLVKPSTLDPSTALVLVNAVYFKGSWDNKFDPSQTKPRPFHVNGKTVKHVPTMHNNGSYRWGELYGLDATFVELPYKRKDDLDGTSMFIILPKEIGGLADLKKNLDKVSKNDLFTSYRRDVDLYLPKFKIEKEIDLAEPLRKMGLTDMLTDAADFSGIADGSSLKVSNVVQKAFVEVNEEGSEAAAATEDDFMDRISGAPLGPIAFVVDRPFVSLIMTEGGLPLFNAIVEDPTIV